MRATAPRDRQVRLEGEGNLHSAAVRFGVKRYVVQSTGFFYGPGQGLASEEEDLAHSASPGVAGSVATYTKIEERLLEIQVLMELRCATASSMVRVPTTIQRVAASPYRSVTGNTRSLSLAPESTRSFISRMQPLRQLLP